VSHPKTYLLLPDVHCPFENKVLMRKINKLACNERFDGLVIMGDWLDMFCLGSYHEGSLYHLREWTLAKEYKAGKAVLDGLLDALGKRCSERHFLFGNHCDRFQRTLAKGDNDKFGGCLERPEEALRLVERGFKVYRNWQEDSVQLGAHAEVVHGLYTPVHHAKKHMDECEGSVFYGHTHRHQIYTTGTRGAYGLGGLGDWGGPGFKYMPRSMRRRWMNSFATVSVFDDGSFLPNPIQCWKNRFIYSGRVY
jgi:predicted phosphodiesterase